MKRKNIKKYIGEFLASAFISFWGLGIAVPYAVFGYVSNLFEYALWFGLACALSGIIFAPISGGHANAGITLSQALFGGFDKKQVLLYWISQTLGWGFGILPVFIIFNNVLDRWVAKTGQMPFELFYCSTAREDVLAAACVEVIMTALLNFSVFFFHDERIPNRPSKAVCPWVIGIVISLAIAFGGGFTGTCMNPSRDLGPRIMGLVYGLMKGYDVSGIFAGGQWLMYILAPLLGAVLGGVFHFGVIIKLLPEKQEV